MLAKWIKASVLCGGLCALLGCFGGTTRTEQLQRVAKDWSLTIRASQVIPVYPLSTDIQPGDLYLVQSTIASQHKKYEEKGFLPLDYMIYRMHPTKYGEFYSASYLVGNNAKKIPAYWIEGGHTSKDKWHLAPRSGFPSYTFKIDKKTGLNIALPVKSVPVGLSILGAEAATGSIVISDGYTYGIDAFSLWQDILELPGEVKSFIATYAPTNSDTSYVRVISRVYLARKLDVYLQSTASFKGGLAAGEKVTTDASADNDSEESRTTAARTDESEESTHSDAASVEPSTSSPETQDTEAGSTLEGAGSSAGEGTSDVVDDEEANVSDSTPSIEQKTSTEETAKSKFGGRVDVVRESARSVSMQETFPTPFVIGYQGFDMAILSDGELGSPIPTFSVLEHQVTPTSDARVFGPEAAAIYRGINEIVERSDSKELTHSAADLIGGDVQVLFDKYISAAKNDNTITDQQTVGVFRRLVTLYLGGETSGSGPRHKIVIRALDTVLGQ